MINATSELNFLYRGLRSHLGFRLRALVAYMFYGHIIRRIKIKKYLDQHAVRKLHLGSSCEVEGFLNSQILGHVPIDITKILPFPRETFDLVYSSHLVEHIHRKQFYKFLREVRRILRPGGIHVIATPSLTKII